jgi:hypothetical protein
MRTLSCRKKLFRTQIVKESAGYAISIDFGVTPSLTDEVSQLCAELGDICVYKTLIRNGARTKSHACSIPRRDGMNQIR